MALLVDLECDGKAWNAHVNLQASFLFLEFALLYQVFVYVEELSGLKAGDKIIFIQQVFS